MVMTTSAILITECQQKYFSQWECIVLSSKTLLNVRTHYTFSYKIIKYLT